MNVKVYDGDYAIIKNSGIGKAIEHQIETLKQIGLYASDDTEKYIDCVHINTVLPKSVFAAIKAKIKNKTIIYYGHSTEEDFKNSFKCANVVSPLFKKWICFCYKLGDVVITPTEYSKGILESYGLNKPIYALSNGINTDFFHKSSLAGKRFRDKYKIATNKKVVISVGHLIERKGILDFIALAKQHPQVQFIWFGDKKNILITAKVKSAVKDAPNNLLFAGFVPKNEIRDAYCGADLFAFLSHEETEGIVVLEALACKIPVLVRDIPVYEGWLCDGVSCYKGKDLSLINDIVQGILSKELNSTVDEGYLVAISRSVKQIGNRLISIYDTLELKKTKEIYEYQN